MTPGIPGAGIGGLFYLGSTLVLTLRHGWRRLRRGAGAGQWRDTMRLAAIAAAIALGIWLAGWLVGLVLSPDLLQAARSRSGAWFDGNVKVQNAVHAAALLVGIGTLALVMGGVELARLWQRWRSARLGAR